MSITQNQIMLLAARLARDAVELEFESLCAEGRTRSLTIEELGKHRIKYMAACEEVYEEMWRSIVDTGVKVQVL